MGLRNYEFKTDLIGRPHRRGMVEGKQDAVIKVLRAQGVEVSKETRKRIEGANDLDLLDLWLDRAVGVVRAEDLFDERPGSAERLMELEGPDFLAALISRVYRTAMAESKAEAVLAVLKVKKIVVSWQARVRVEKTTDLGQLDFWLDRAVRAERAEDVFGEGC